jgi:hypothetical protein
MHYAAKRVMAQWRYSPLHSEPWHKINVYGTMEVQPGAFRTLAQDQHIWTALHPGHFVPCGKSSQVPTKKRMGEPQLIWML